MSTTNAEIQQTAPIQPLFHCALLRRLSSKAQGEEEKGSLDEMITWAKNFCKLNNGKLIKIYDDILPGDTPYEDRPGGSLLLNDAKKSLFNLVLIYHSSRNAREPWVGLKFISDLGKLGVQVYTRNAPVEPVPPDKYIYGSNTAAEYVNALSLIGDKQENVARSERVTFGFLNLAKRGTLVFAPYGFRKAPKIEIDASGKQRYSWSFEIDPAKSVIVVRIYNEFYEGKSLRKIVKSLISDKIPSPVGKSGLGSWTSRTVRNILTNPAYCGMVRWGRKKGSKYREGRSSNGKQKRVVALQKDWILTPATNCAKIINASLFEKIQGQVRQHANMAGRQLATPVLLSGLIYCGLCGRRSLTKTRVFKKRERTYTRTDFLCQSYFLMLSCKRHVMTAAKLDNLVLTQLQTRLSQLKVNDINTQIETKDFKYKQMLADTHASITKQIQNQSLKQARLLAIYLAGTITKEKYTTEKYKLDKEEMLLTQEKNKIQNILSDNKQQVDALKTLKELLVMFSTTTDLMLKKEMLQRILEKVVIYKDKIELIYKHQAVIGAGRNLHPYG